MIPTSQVPQAVGGIALVIGIVWIAVRFGWGIEGLFDLDKAMALRDKRCRRRYWWRDQVLVQELKRLKRKGDLLTHVHGQRR